MFGKHPEQFLKSIYTMHRLGFGRPDLQNGSMPLTAKLFKPASAACWLNVQISIPEQEGASIYTMLYLES